MYISVDLICKLTGSVNYCILGKNEVHNRFTRDYVVKPSNYDSNKYSWSH